MLDGIRIFHSIDRETVLCSKQSNIFYTRGVSCLKFENAAFHLFLGLLGNN